MEEYINEILEKKIDEVFSEVQEKFSVKHGDVEPLDIRRLMEIETQMSALIGDMIRKQMKEEVIE